MKKQILMLAMLMAVSPCFATETNDGHYEYLFEEKNATDNQVLIKADSNVMQEGNGIRIAFEKKFKSEKAKPGEEVNFIIKESIYTKEGTLIIPAESKINAKVIKIEKQRVPNKNARVYFRFDTLKTPDGTVYEMSATPNTKDGSLKEGPWMTAGKVAAYTVGLGAVGAGAGAGFAFIPNPTNLGAGFAIGIPVGAGVGLIAGLITPGLKYHAKAGEEIVILLSGDLQLNKQKEVLIPESASDEDEADDEIIEEEDD